MEYEKKSIYIKEGTKKCMKKLKAQIIFFLI